MTRFPFVALAITLAACTSPSGPQTGSQTNWLITCDSSSDCDPGVECVCGACTRSCSSETACGDLPGTSCVASSDQGSIALCSGQAPPSGLCLPRCDDVTCASGTTCLAGVCVPALDTTVTVTLDTTARHQELVGFGASLAYADDRIVANARKAELYDLMFADAGLDVLRLRNRYQDPDDTALVPADEIVTAATQRLGRKPLLFMSSSTPPAALKGNGSRTCTAADTATCTLASLPGGGFNYAGFADYWRSAVQAYSNVGVAVDYISIQNHANWFPGADPGDACLLLPEEGTTTVTVDGAPVDATLAGYREALEAVHAAIADLPTPPQIGVPEVTGVRSLSEYVTPLDPSTFDVLALHLYGVDPTAVDLGALAADRDLAAGLGLPIFQTEMQADGLDTAVLAQHALTTGGASVYLQNDLISWTPEGAPIALALLSDDALEVQGPYYALSHFSKHTDPGWVRVDATSDSSGLLSSAWLSPDESELTIVLVNPGTEEVVVDLVLPAAVASELVQSEVTRTVFEGIERFAVLGELPASGAVRVPGGSIMTVALASE